MVFILKLLKILFVLFLYIINFVWDKDFLEQATTHLENWFWLHFHSLNIPFWYLAHHNCTRTLFPFARHKWKIVYILCSHSKRHRSQFKPLTQNVVGHQEYTGTVVGIYTWYTTVYFAASYTLFTCIYMCVCIYVHMYIYVCVCIYNYRFINLWIITAFSRVPNTYSSGAITMLWWMVTSYSCNWVSCFLRLSDRYSYM